MYKELQLKILN